MVEENGKAILKTVAPVRGIWFADGVAIDTAESIVISNTAAYTVKAIAGSCMSADSDPFELLITDTPTDLTFFPFAFPNPTTGIVHLFTPNSGHSSLVVFSHDGRKLSEVSYSGGFVSLDLTRFRPGVYVIRIAKDKIRYHIKVIRG